MMIGRLRELVLRIYQARSTVGGWLVFSASVPSCLASWHPNSCTCIYSFSLSWGLLSCFVWSSVCLLDYGNGWCVSILHWASCFLDLLPYSLQCLNHLMGRWFLVNAFSTASYHWLLVQLSRSSYPFSSTQWGTEDTHCDCLSLKHPAGVLCCEGHIIHLAICRGG